MKFSTVLGLFAATTSVLSAPLEKRAETDPAKTTKTILLTNDDGWAATNIRATYRELTSAGYEVILISPVSQRSGFGGQFSVPPTVNLTTNGEFNYPAKGAPSWGHEEDDLNVWYFNGTPSSCVAFGLTYVIPKHFDNKTVDLVVAGPNEGTNMGAGFYTLSGTIGATYAAVNRGIPGIAFSGSNGNNSFFKDDVAKESDPKFAPNIYANKIVEFVDRLFNSSANHPHLLPVTAGINVNFPPVGYADESCLDPEWVFARLSGQDSLVPNMAYNETSGLFGWASVKYSPVTECIFGDCDLPSESWLLLENTCKTSVSVFSIDYDANYKQTQTVEKYLGPLFA